ARRACAGRPRYRWRRPHRYRIHATMTVSAPSPEGLSRAGVLQDACRAEPALQRTDQTTGWVARRPRGMAPGLVYPGITPNTLTDRDLGPMFWALFGSRALGRSSTDDDGWRHPRACARGQRSNSVPGGYRAPRTAHLSGVVPAGRRRARRLPGPLPRPGAVCAPAGGAAEPRPRGRDSSEDRAVGDDARPGPGAAAGERLSPQPAGRVSRRTDARPGGAGA